MKGKELTSERTFLENLECEKEANQSFPSFLFNLRIRGTAPGNPDPDLPVLLVTVTGPSSPGF